MNPLIPETLETPRLHLRRFVEADWDDLCVIYANEECVRYTLKMTQERWQTWRILAAFVGHWQLRGYGPYAVVQKASGNLIGPVGLWCPGEWPEPEIKWALAKEFWGQGFATEAAAAVKQMVQSELKWKRLVSFILSDNLRSIAVAKRLGASYEKTIDFRMHPAQVYRYSI